MLPGCPSHYMRNQMAHYVPTKFQLDRLLGLHPLPSMVPLHAKDYILLVKKTNWNKMNTF